MSIKRLPGDVVAQIKSSLVITSLNHVVIGLIENALDAQATRINISVDYSQGNCSVEDDGLGIAPSDFHAEGTLGNLHCTSRYPPTAGIHGRYGMFLASLGTLSLLSITSHHHEYHSHNSMTIHNSRVVARNLPALPEQRVLSFPTGTRVTVRDLFGSMPVRVKHRALTIDQSRSARDFDQLVRHVVGLLLVWPEGVSVSLRDASSRKVLSLRTARAASGTSKRPEGEGLSASMILSRMPSLLSQSSLFEAVDTSSWTSVGASAPGVTIIGCVSLIPIASKQLQFLSLGIQPFTNDHGSNVLYEEVNRVFANSGFGMLEESDDDSESPPTSTAIAKEPRVQKGVDRWPMFCIQINLTGKLSHIAADDLLEDSTPQLATITDLLRVTAFEFLKKNHFHPKPVNAFSHLMSSSRSSRPNAGGEPGSTSGRSGSRSRGSKGSRSRGAQQLETDARPASPFAGWSTVKTGRPVFPREPKATLLNLQDSTSSGGGRIGTSTNGGVLIPKPRLFGKSGKVLRKPFLDDELPSPKKPTPTAQVDGGPPAFPAVPGLDSGGETVSARETIVWVDPATKIRTLIDARTGFVMNQKRSRLTLPVSISSSTQPTRTVSPSNPLVKEMIVSWKNPVFESVEPAIPRIPDTLEGMGHDIRTHGCQGHPALTLGDNTDVTTLGSRKRISRQALQMAEVLRQVDRKFILVRVPGDSLLKQSATGHVDHEHDVHLLVLIDQHAADERCQVEDLMNTYFAVDPDNRGIAARSEKLWKPLRFDLSKQDGDLLVQYRSHFSYWGICYELFASEEQKEQQKKRSMVTVDVQSLPPSILERCRLEPRLLIDLLRKEAWQLHDSNDRGLGHTPIQTTEPRGENLEHEWFSRFHGCPQGILDLIHSRSCRSAIMFNDELSIEQCRDLLHRLTKCAFPFQCAHGRPSMVPLVNLSHGCGGLGQMGVGEQTGQDLWKKLKRLKKRGVPCG